MNSIDKLTEIFSKFPGIGPRQAKRFVYFILSRSGDYAGELTRAVLELKKEIVQCARCLRFFPRPAEALAQGEQKCATCSDESRDTSMLMVVPRDIDFEAVEKSGSYKGYYFILGGIVPILEKEPEKKVRSQQLEVRVKEGIKNGLKEIVIAMNANQDGENTAEYLKEKLKNFELQTSVLGRGLSTGTELEYADPETLKNAFLHRTK